MTNIIQSLNAGSGIDVQALTKSLLEAEREPIQKMLDNRQTRVDARISAMAQFRAGLDGIVTALKSRIESGALSAIPRISDPSVLTMKVNAGVFVPSQQIEVRQLARAQTLASGPIADSSAAIGQGTLTLRFGSVAGTDAATAFTPGALANLVITIDPTNDNLDGLKNAINDAAAQAGLSISARIVSDTDGSRLMITGPSGDESGFTIETAGDPGLERFAFSQGATAMQRTQNSQDAILAVNGLALRRPSNVVSDIIEGATLTLVKAAIGQPVGIVTNRDTADLAQSVRDIAHTFNELRSFGKELTQAGTETVGAGALAADSATRRVMQQLGSITTTELFPKVGEQPNRLFEIGLSVDRFGAFVVDEVKLAKALSEYPEAIETMVIAMNASETAVKPAGALRQMADSFRLAATGRSGEKTALQLEAESITKDRTRLEERLTRMEANYTKQFSALERAVGQSKQTMEFLKQQIDMWTGRNND